MKEAKDITALVFDHGLFLPVARQLAKSYKRVLYQTPCEKAFTTLNDCIVGDGFPDIEKCDDFWPIKNEIDLFIFPDIQHSGLQLELESQGFPVWGSRTGDTVEMQRRKFLNTLKDLGLNVPPHEAVKGLTALRAHLRDKENKFIKISRFRGSLETTKFRNWELDEGLLDQWAVKFGPAKDLLTFLVFDELETNLEIGGDTFCIDGQWPQKMLQGYEWKDKGYVASVRNREEMPEAVQEVLQKFARVLGPLRYRNFWSMELRVVGKEAYFIDACARGPMPATGSQIQLIKNIGEVIWHGARGELVEPDMSHKFSAECILTTKAEKTAWSKTVVPDELADTMKCSNACEIDGAVCFPPTECHGEEIGWLVATGDTISGTIETMLSQAKELPDGVNANTESLVDLLAEIHEAEAKGIEFTPQTVPEPETALESTH